jgi:probable HAF family extracellular repeat protein
VAEIPGLSSLISADINNLGQVVSRNLLWMPDVPNGTTGTLTNLGPSVFAYAINDAGQVVGYTVPLPGEYHIFLWHGGAMTDLGAGVAADISASGQLTGHWPDGIAFVWTPSTPNGTSGTFAGLPLPGSGGEFTVGLAQSINDAGEVVGNYFWGNLGEGGFESSYGVIWSGGQMYNLGGLVVPEIPLGSAEAINCAGQIAGSQEVWGPHFTLVSHASLLTPVSGKRPVIARLAPRGSL